MSVAAIAVLVRTKLTVTPALSAALFIVMRPVQTFNVTPVAFPLPAPWVTVPPVL
jgi:hypothetical protein